MNRVHTAVEIILWIIGAVLLAVYFAARAHGDLEARQGVAAFEQVREQVRHQALASAYEPETVAEPDQIAVLRIPGAEIEVPVYRDLTERNLNRGVTMIDGTTPLGVPGNAGIAGHRDSFFRGLQHVAVGDIVEVEDLTAMRTYRITNLSVVEPTDVSVLDPTDSQVITLVTCYPFYFAGNAPQRYIVRAEATE